MRLGAIPLSIAIPAVDFLVKSYSCLNGTECGRGGERGEGVRRQGGEELSTKQH